MEILSGSRTALIATFFSLSCWFFLLKNKIKIVYAMLGVIFISFFLFQSSMIPSSYTRKTSSGNSITTLSSRQKLWIATYTLFKEKPFIGYGYGVSGKIFSDHRYMNKKYRLWRGSSRVSIHNGYLSIIAGVGLIGFTIWFFAIYQGLKNALASPKSENKALVVTVMLTILLINFVESSAGGINVFLGVIFYFFWFLAYKLKLIHEHSKEHFERVTIGHGTSPYDQ
jgi:O-antigen ligase